MDMDDITVYNDDFSYSYYKKLVNRCMDIDWREIIFQYRVVVPFLDKLFTNDNDLFIVDISEQYENKNSNMHNTIYYKKMGDYSPADLLISRHWNYANNGNDKIDYLAVVEVKSPKLNESIYNKETYSKKMYDRLETYLEVNDKVILTDCIKWQFFEKEIGLDPVKTINLYDKNNKWKRKVGKTPEFVVEQLQLGNNFDDTPDEWNQLCEYIRHFISSRRSVTK